MKFKLIFLTLFFFQFSFGQTNLNEIKPGLYGIYGDRSSYQELTISRDGTFEFHDRVELGSSSKYKGKWKAEENQVVLYGFRNSKTKPIPTKFTPNAKGDQLCTDTKDKICLKWQEPKAKIEAEQKRQSK